MDGRVLTEIFEPGDGATEPIYVVDEYNEIVRRSLATSVRRDSLEKQLRTLGYIR
jgi:hypothetical protein